MDIPGIMKEFGNNEGTSLLNSIVKAPSLKPKEVKEGGLTNVFMDLDPDSKRITFQPGSYAVAENRSAKSFNYFGNNQAAAKQMYAVREAGSFMQFWIGRPKGILKNIQEALEDGALQNLFRECESAGLFNEKGINTEAFTWEGKTEETSLEFSAEEKSLYLNKEKISPEKFLLKCLGGESNTKIVLVIPRIIKNNEEIIISTHEDYCAAIAKSLEGKKEGAKGICHICGKERPDINTKEYSSNFLKSGIGKVFVTTTVNYAPDFERRQHQQNYSICKDCYEKLMFGERRVMSEYRIRIAGEDSVVLFEGLDRPIDYMDEGLEKMKSGIDVVFNPKDTRQWYDNLLQHLQYEDIFLYQFSLILYKTDGKSCAIKKTIESINNIRFASVNQTFENVRVSYGNELPSFTLGHLYSMVPVSSNKKGEQLNVQRLLDLYGAILKGELIEKRFLFDLFSECLDAGLTSIMASEVRNYKNLYKLELLHRKEWGRDQFIKRMSLSYLALIEILQELNIIDKEALHMNETATKDFEKKEVLEAEERSPEDYLNQHGFPENSKGLFYMGMFMHEIGQAQYKQGHKNKPILDKVTYTGMNKNDVMNLWADLMEKMRQYSRPLSKNKRYGYCEWLLKQVTIHLNNYPGDKPLSEKENVFYIMSGYGFCVGSYKKQDNDNTDEKVNDMEEENND